MHPTAQAASESAFCAGTQGRFWEVHDRLFQKQADISAERLDEIVSVVGLDVLEFRKCLSARAAVAVQVDIDLGRALGVAGTPVFFIGRHLPDHTVRVTGRITGNRSADAFRSALRTALGGS